MIDEILLQVEKPARYIGNEVNMVVKNPKDVDIRFAFCFPDVYEVGMSHLGLQILYYFLNRREDTYCERCFTPWVDMEQKMRENNIPLFCLESGDELKKFDFVGFTLQYEMSYTNVLNMLDLANIPIWSKDRTEDDPIIIAGGPCAYNPEPLADIIDVFYIGEGEVSYDKFFDVYKEHKKNGGTKEASASEIVSGSLQDLDRAIVVGSRTYGKGLVQVPRELPYNSSMKVTTAKYYIPSGRCIQAIDYAKRNADGSVARTPDSLTNVFHTAAGREVRDGGGIRPDVEVKVENFPNIMFYLLNDDMIFDYATQYCIKHSQVGEVKDFTITDADYVDFKKMLHKRKFTYDRQSEKMLKNLKEIAEFEGYMDGAKEEFAALETKLTHNLDHELDRFSKEIKDAIAQEILKRYYFQRGAILQRLKDDPDLKKAIETLNNQSEYSKILSVMK